MAFLSIFRPRNIRKLLIVPCFTLGVVLLLLHAKGSQPKWRNTIKTTPYMIHGEYIWDKNKFNAKEYLKGENIRINIKKQKTMAPLSIKYNENYSQVKFISKGDKYLLHGFDSEASNSIPMGRNLPDTRHQSYSTTYKNQYNNHAIRTIINSSILLASVPERKETHQIVKCRDAMYDNENLLTSSVIISFHNEARSTLLRTIVSILQRTPPSILEEIILVDDNSDDGDDGSLLSALPKVHVIRNKNTEGVARSRSLGARNAEGDILVFLDSHCEVNLGWLEPLVDLLIAAPKALVSPAIDQIDKDDFEYKVITTYFKGGFDWRLHFKWIPLTAHEVRQMGSPTHPFWSPVVAGGMFAASRDWFFEIGAYDSGFKGLGAEDIEISLKSWLCGGSVYICPCSRIGHVFRSKYLQKHSPGASEDFVRNAKRLAEVWLDEYKIFFYRAQPSAYDVKMGSMEQSVTTKQNLECKSFRWFLEGIYPELKLPNDEVIAFGQLKQGMRCLAEKLALVKGHEMEFNQSYQKGRKDAVHLEICDERSANQQGWTYGGRIKSAVYKSNRCLTAISTSQKELKRQKKKRNEKKWKGQSLINGRYSISVGLRDCNNTTQQKWTRYGRLLYNNFSKLCLEICHAKNSVISLTSPMTLCLGPCTKGHSTQLWEFTIEMQSSRNNGVHLV